MGGAAAVSYTHLDVYKRQTNLWAASYLTGLRGVSAQTAAQWTSLFFLGITAGRLVTGFATIKFQARTLMRVGQGCCLAGILFLLLPLPNVFAALGLALIGLGCAPLYPLSLIHISLTRRFTCQWTTSNY